VNRFELNMHEAGFHKSRKLMLLIVEKSLKAVETLHEPFGRGRNKRSIPGPGSSDPVLCPAKLTGHLVGSPSAPQQNCVDLPNQAQRERKSLAQAFQTMLHGGDVVRNFLHVLDGDVRYLIVLKQESGRRTRTECLRSERRPRPPYEHTNNGGIGCRVAA
jgi:hypothetical protein